MTFTVFDLSMRNMSLEDTNTRMFALFDGCTFAIPLARYLIRHDQDCSSRAPDMRCIVIPSSSLIATLNSFRSSGRSSLHFECQAQ